MNLNLKSNWFPFNSYLEKELFVIPF